MRLRIIDVHGQSFAVDSTQLEGDNGFDDDADEVVLLKLLWESIERGVPIEAKFEGGMSDRLTTIIFNVEHVVRVQGNHRPSDPARSLAEVEERARLAEVGA